METKGFFPFEIIINVLGQFSLLHVNFYVRGLQSLWIFFTPTKSIVHRFHILTSKVDPRAVTANCAEAVLYSVDFKTLVINECKIITICGCGSFVSTYTSLECEGLNHKALHSPEWFCELFTTVNVPYSPCLNLLHTGRSQPLPDNQGNYDKCGL